MLTSEILAQVENGKSSINELKKDEKKRWCNNKTFVYISFIFMILCFIVTMIIQGPDKILKAFGFFSSTDCPSSSWIYCAQENNKCYIPSNIQYTTVAYGRNGKWTFQDFTNIDSTLLNINCNNNGFGEINYGAKKICCYNSFATNGPSTSESSWTKICNEGNKPMVSWGLVRYGANNRYTYRYSEGQLFCNNNYFNDPYSGKEKACYRSNTAVAQPSWKVCGSEQGGSCNLNVDTTLTNIKRLVKYSYGGLSSYRTVISINGNVDCNNQLFDDPYSGKNKICYVSSISNSQIFSDIVGSWQQVGSCLNCPLTRTLSEGVTSTSLYATTSTWSAALSTTVKTECSFLGTGAKVAVSASTGYSIATTMSTSFSKTSTQSCSATCPSTGQWYMFQWTLSVGEYSDSTYKTFSTYACNYICIPTNTPPQCPLNFCADSTCQTCLSYT